MSAATGPTWGASSRAAIAAAAWGMPFVMLTVSTGRATRSAAVPKMYIATIATPDKRIPRRSVAAGSWISPPSVGASSRPANANVIVAKKLTSE